MTSAKAPLSLGRGNAQKKQRLEGGEQRSEAENKKMSVIHCDEYLISCRPYYYELLGLATVIEA